MRRSRSFVTALVVTALLATAFSLVASSAKAQDATRLFHEGRVLAMSFTDITVQEDGTGKQTYSLAPTGLWTLEAEGVVPGDRIGYTVYGSSGYAHDFQKFSN